MRFLVLLIPLFLFAKSWFVNFDEAVKYAKKENKLILLYFYSEHCPYCYQVEEFVFSDENVEKFLEKSFIIVSINVDEDEEIVEKFFVFGTPTFIIYDPKREKVVGRFFGSYEKDKFLSLLIKFCNKSSVRRCMS